MTTTVTVEEGDGHQVRCDWKDGEGVSVVPNTTRYRVDCKTTAASQIAWTSITPAASILITIPGTANAIVDSANESEVRQITVQANWGEPDQKTLRDVWVVVNNDFFS